MQQNNNKYFAHRTPLHDDPREWGQKVKMQLFQNMVILHIKLKGIRQCSNFLAIDLPADPSLPPLSLRP